MYSSNVRLSSMISNGGIDQTMKVALKIAFCVYVIDSYKNVEEYESRRYLVCWTRHQYNHPMHVMDSADGVDNDSKVRQLAEMNVCKLLAQWRQVVQRLSFENCTRLSAYGVRSL